MADTTPAPTRDLALTPADAADVADTLAFALRYQRGKRTDTAGEMMARITAEHLVEHLRQCGYVVLKRPPIPSHGATYQPPGK